VLELLKKRRKRESGWLAISMDQGRMHYAHGRPGVDGNSIIRCGSELIADDNAFDHVSKALELERYQCLTVLQPSDYQLLLIEAPNVPPTEVKQAARWRIKDMLDYPVDAATIEVLDIPVDADLSNHGRSIYAVAAKNEVIQAHMHRFARLRLRLSVIDIAETAQRNIATLLEPPGRGVAMLYPARDHILLTVSYRSDLYLARRIDVGLSELEALDDSSDGTKNRVLLELQRSFDHVDRQFPFVGVAKVLVAPTPVDTGLQSYLASSLDVPVEEVRLAELLDLAPEVELEREAAWRLFHVLGATLRTQAAAS
jgi:MSHA biogenesis protein MshI